VPRRRAASPEVPSTTAAAPAIAPSTSSSAPAASSAPGRPEGSSEQAALFVAASQGDAADVRRALRRGAEADVVALGPCLCGQDEAACVCLGYSPLHCACQAGSTAAVFALLTASADPCARSGRILFHVRPRATEEHQEGEEVEDSDGFSASLSVVDGLTPLHVAAACGHRRIVSLLLRHFADPHIGAAEPRKTALGFALEARELGIAELLRQAGAERAAQRAAATVGTAESFLARQGGAASAAQALSSPRLEAIRQRVRARLSESSAVVSEAGEDKEQQQQQRQHPLGVIRGVVRLGSSGGG